MLLNREKLKELIRRRGLSGKDDFNDLMGSLTREVIETFLEGELTDSLGYEKYDHEGKEIVELIQQRPPNSRNGSSKKTVKSKYGELTLKVPRDRNGEFSPELVKKGQSNIIGLEEKVLSLYARGASTRDISSHVEEIYGYKLSAETVSAITDQVQDRLSHWQSRPLEPIYAIIYLDCLFVKARSESGPVKNMAVYNILGITLEGKKECLGLWVREEGESSKYWLGILTELKNRGLEDVLIFSVDNLRGFSEALTAIYPQAEIQKCIVHQIRNSNKYVPYKDRRELSSDLKTIYQSSTEQQGRSALGKFEDKWGKKYPHVISSWRSNWPELATFFKYPPAIRKLIYTTNPIESVNGGIRRVIKTKGALPKKSAVEKLTFLKIERMSEKWTKPIGGWCEISPYIMVYFKERVEKYL